MPPRTVRRPPNDLTHLYAENPRPELRDASRLAVWSGSWRGGTKALRYLRVYVIALASGQVAVVWRYVTLLDGASGQVRYGTYGGPEEAARAIQSFDGLPGVPPDAMAAYTEAVAELLRALGDADGDR